MPARKKEEEKIPSFPYPTFPPKKKRKSVPIHSMQISALPPLSVWRKSTIINWDNRRRPTKGGFPPLKIGFPFPYSFPIPFYKKLQKEAFVPFLWQNSGSKSKTNFCFCIFLPKLDKKDKEIWFILLPRESEIGDLDYLPIKPHFPFFSTRQDIISPSSSSFCLSHFSSLPFRQRGAI